MNADTLRDAYWKALYTPGARNVFELMAQLLNEGDAMNADMAAIRADVLREMRERVRALDPNSSVLHLIDLVEARWEREGKLDPPRVADVEDGTHD